MCLQCLTNPVVYNKRIGSMILMKSTKDPDYSDWRKGYYGLVEMNDPSFIIKHEPLPVKDEWLDRNYDVSEADSSLFWEAYERACQIEEDILQSTEYLYCIQNLLAALGSTDKHRVGLLLMKKFHEAINSGTNEAEEEVEDARNLN